MEMSGERLGPEEWVNAGLRALANSGFTALKADTLAKTLGVSRGSFYWHFTDVGAFHAAVLRRWREIALENIVAAIDKTPGDRLEALMHRAFSARSTLEVAIRAWAFADADARAAVDAVDAERVRYLQKLLIEAGVAPALAETRAQIINWTYLGHSLSPRKRDSDELRSIIAILSQLAHWRPPPQR
jgi:AcrR family transcriptional regulator